MTLLAAGNFGCMGSTRALIVMSHLRDDLLCTGGNEHRLSTDQGPGDYHGFSAIVGQISSGRSNFCSGSPSLPNITKQLVYRQVRACHTLDLTFSAATSDETDHTIFSLPSDTGSLLMGSSGS